MRKRGRKESKGQRGWREREMERVYKRCIMFCSIRHKSETRNPLPQASIKAFGYSTHVRQTKYTITKTLQP